MTDQSRIALNADVLAGKPVIRGTRLSVEFLIGLMADGWTETDILQNYPGIIHDDIIACLAYARSSLRLEKAYRAMAADEAREREALAWSETLIDDICGRKPEGRPR